MAKETIRQFLILGIPESILVEKGTRKELLDLMGQFYRADFRRI